MCREAGHLRAPIQSNHLRGGRQGLTPASSEEDENMRSAYFRKLIFQTVSEQNTVRGILRLIRNGHRVQGSPPCRAARSGLCPCQACIALLNAALARVPWVGEFWVIVAVPF